jgi:hypothetical protein
MPPGIDSGAGAGRPRLWVRGGYRISTSRALSLPVGLVNRT